METGQLIVLCLLGLLLAAVLLWLWMWRYLDPEAVQDGSYRRLNQGLIILITVLILLTSMLIIFSSDPGNPDNYQFLP